MTIKQELKIYNLSAQANNAFVMVQVGIFMDWDTDILWDCYKKADDALFKCIKKGLK